MSKKKPSSKQNLSGHQTVIGQQHFTLNPMISCARRIDRHLLFLKRSNCSKGGHASTLSLGERRTVNAPTLLLRYPRDPLISRLFAMQCGVSHCVRLRARLSRKCEVRRCRPLSHHWCVSQTSKRICGLASCEEKAAEYGCKNSPSCFWRCSWNTRAKSSPVKNFASAFGQPIPLSILTTASRWL
jgi:hypothetical protein